MKEIAQASNTFWGNHFFFRKKFISRENLENCDFLVTLYNQSLLDRFINPKIGSFSGSALRVYAEKDHTKLNSWGLLTNPEISYTDVMGYVKYSVSFIKSGQKRTNLEIQNMKQKKNRFS